MRRSRSVWRHKARARVSLAEKAGSAGYGIVAQNRRGARSSRMCAVRSAAAPKPNAQTIHRRDAETQRKPETCAGRAVYGGTRREPGFRSQRRRGALDMESWRRIAEARDQAGCVLFEARPLRSPTHRQFTAETRRRRENLKHAQVAQCMAAQGESPGFARREGGERWIWNRGAESPRRAIKPDVCCSKRGRS